MTLSHKSGQHSAAGTQPKPNDPNGDEWGRERRNLGTKWGRMGRNGTPQGWGERRLPESPRLPKIDDCSFVASPACPCARKPRAPGTLSGSAPASGRKEWG